MTEVRTVHQMYVDGEWLDSTGGGRIPVFNPSTGEVFEEVPSATIDDVRGAVDAAKVAFASDNGKVWLALRPAVNAKSTPPGIVTVEGEVFGLPPLPVSRRVVAEYLQQYRSGSR